MVAECLREPADAAPEIERPAAADLDPLFSPDSAVGGTMVVLSYARPLTRSKPLDYCTTFRWHIYGSASRSCGCDILSGRFRRWKSLPRCSLDYLTHIDIWQLFTSSKTILRKRLNTASSRDGFPILVAACRRSRRGFAGFVWEVAARKA